MEKQLILIFLLISNVKGLDNKIESTLFFNQSENIVKCHQKGFICHIENKTLSYNDVCNGIADCPDESDEKCEECQTSHFCEENIINLNIQITHKKCLRGSALCNGLNDCQNGSDETLFCRSHCYRNEFQCRDKKMCIPYTFICDGDDHCKDGHDEENCNGKCQNGSKWCNSSKKCIPKWKLCDGIKDCADGNDENECSCESCTGENNILCITDKKQNIGTCILKEHICDRISHCPNQMDEMGCPGWCEKSNNDDLDYINCDGKRYHKLYACDGMHSKCNGLCSECHWSAYNCGNGHCIGRGYVCNGYKDCDDGSDEENCNYHNDHEYMLCKTKKGDPKKYILKKYLCDGILDCPFNDDEENCLSCKGEDTFWCKADKKCIKAKYRCNGLIECSDQSDEINCDCDACSIHPDPLYFCSTGNRCHIPDTLCIYPTTTCPSSYIDDAYCARKTHFDMIHSSLNIV